MKGLAGILLAAGGLVIGTWSLSKAIQGQDFFGWIATIGLIAAGLGALLAPIRLKKSMSN